MKNSGTSAKTAQLYQKIQEDLDNQSFKTLFKDIARFERMGKMTDEKRLQLSHIRESVNQFYQALKILGPEIDLDEMMVVSPSKLVLQLRVAYLLNYIGARYVAWRIYQNLEKVFTKRKIDPHKLYPNYIYNYIYFCRLNDLYIRLLEVGEKFAPLLLKGSAHEGMFHMQIAFGLHNLDRSEEALKILNRLLVADPQYPTNVRGLIHRAIAEISIELRDITRAEEHCKIAQHLFAGNNLTRERLLIQMTEGKLYLIKGMRYESKQAFAQALPLLSNNIYNPRDLLSILYRMQNERDFMLLLSYQVAIRAHKNFNYHAYLLGKKFYPHPGYLEKLPSWLMRDYIGDPFDCWIVIKGQIFACNYQELDYAFLKSTNEDILDLYSGFKIDGQSKERIHFTDLQGNCLTTIVSHGGTGASKWTVYDNTYRDLRLTEVGLERIRDMTDALKKMGIRIRRENNFYFYNFNRHEIIFLPMDDLLIHGPLPFIRHHFQQFSRPQIEKFLGIKKTAAAELIKEWLEEGLIKAHGQGRQVYYSFN